jgi:hypothetical protein
VTTTVNDVRAVLFALPGLHGKSTRPEEFEKFGAVATLTGHTQWTPEEMLDMSDALAGIGVDPDIAMEEAILFQ